VGRFTLSATGSPYPLSLPRHEALRLASSHGNVVPRLAATVEESAAVSGQMCGKDSRLEMLLDGFAGLLHCIFGNVHRRVNCGRTAANANAKANANANANAVAERCALGADSNYDYEPPYCGGRELLLDAFTVKMGDGIQEQRAQSRVWGGGAVANRSVLVPRQRFAGPRREWNKEQLQHPLQHSQQGSVTGAWRGRCPRCQFNSSSGS
jgi:hypothetical protein